MGWDLGRSGMDVKRRDRERQTYLARRPSSDDQPHRGGRSNILVILLQRNPWRHGKVSGVFTPGLETSSPVSGNENPWRPRKPNCSDDRYSTGWYVIPYPRVEMCCGSMIISKRRIEEEIGTVELINRNWSLSQLHSIKNCHQFIIYLLARRTGRFTSRNWLMSGAWSTSWYAIQRWRLMGRSIRWNRWWWATWRHLPSWWGSTQPIILRPSGNAVGAMFAPRSCTSFPCQTERCGRRKPGPYRLRGQKRKDRKQHGKPMQGKMRWCWVSPYSTSIWSRWYLACCTVLRQWRECCTLWLSRLPKKARKKHAPIYSCADW